ncbi:MAG: metallophosphoesterase family protein, partial [Pseudomonadales bacterium]|nr:metallophosphoesterase family protein [Pseudomonadales bacterium]
AMVDGVPLLSPDNVGLGVVHYHSAVFRGLEPDTLYAYRVQGADGAWSEWYQTRTAAESGPVKFVYFGDAQNGILSHWSRVVRAAFMRAPDARFFLHAGDMVNRAARDFEWAEWFKAGGFVHGSVPAVVVVGNHEVQSYGIGDRTSERVLTHLWRPQFTLPVDSSLPLSLHETVYDVRYNEDVHLFVLNSLSREFELQAQWLDRKLEETDARWRIVTMHYPIFSSAEGRDGASRRDALLPILNKHRVDLVLQGHDHTYARGAIGQSPERMATGEGEGVEVMFVNSVSGAKMYSLKPDGWDGYAEHGVRLQRAAENTPFYQVVSIEDSKLIYEAYTADDQLYDYFEMVKGANGLKSLSRGERETINARQFLTTGEYANAPALP